MYHSAWDGAYKIFLAANREVTDEVAAVGFLFDYLNGPSTFPAP